MRGRARRSDAVGPSGAEVPGRRARLADVRARVSGVRPGAWVSGRSLRWRVTALSVVVVAVALLVIGVAVDLALSAQLRRDQESRLDDRATRTALLVAAGTTGTDLRAQVDGQGIRAVLVTSAGAVVADAGRGPDPDGGPGRGRGGPGRGTGFEGPGVEGPGSGGPGSDRDLVRTQALPDGGRVVLSVDPGENVGVLAALRTVMVVVGGVGLVVVAFALLAAVRVALRPLEEMTGLARDIAAGDRGRRLHPARTDTELGRTAEAFDEMLDALEAAQARAEEAAAQAQRSEATTRSFLSDAAHELRTPITGVQTLAETLVRHPDTELERRERIATTLVRETRRAGSLVADMLELARIEGGPVLDRADVDLGPLVAAAGERAALLAPALTVRTEAGAPVRAFADPSRVTQILANLLDNARRHSPEGGVIRLEVADDADRATVTVADEGPGVPAADRERVFDRLVRLDDARTRDAGGAGLGLSIARALARAQGGDLVYVPAADGGPGARFRLSLPRS